MYRGRRLGRYAIRRRPGDLRETVRRTLNRVRQRLLKQGIPRAQQLSHFETSFRIECWARA